MEERGREEKEERSVGKENGRENGDTHGWAR